MTSSDGQVTGSAAELYERFFVPALLGQLASPVAETAELRRGDKVLDVACGTGVVAREALRRVAPSGEVTGLDLNPGMLAVARRLESGVTWREGRAEELPFSEGTFDAVTCQFGLMFFPDRPRAISEMWRVLRPGGRLAAAVWGRIEDAPGYVALGHLLRRRVGEDAAREIDAPFVLGDDKAFAALFDEAGVRGVAVRTYRGEARFPSLEEWIHVEVRGWTLAEQVSEAQYAELLSDARRELAVFLRPDGTVRFPVSALIASATRHA